MHEGDQTGKRDGGDHDVSEVDGSDLTWVEARGIASGYDRIGWSVIKGFNISLPSDAIPTGIRLTDEQLQMEQGLRVVSLLN